MLSLIHILLDILLYGTPEEKKALVAEQRKEVMKLEQRFAERRSAPRHSRSQDVYKRQCILSAIFGIKKLFTVVWQ